MPDEDEALAAELDTPSVEPESGPDQGTPATPESEDSTPSVDWEKRYNDLQPEYTRASQEAAQLRQLEEIITLAEQGDADAQRWIAERVGWELEDDEDDFDDEPEYRDPRVDQLLQVEAERQQEAQLDQMESDVESEIEHLAKEAGLDLSDDEVDLVFAALTPGADGNPDVKAAFAKVTGISKSAVDRYRKSKKAPQVDIGAAGSEELKTDTADDRAYAIAQLMDAAEQ